MGKSTGKHNGTIHVLHNGMGGGGEDVQFRLFQYYMKVYWQYHPTIIIVMRGWGLKFPEKALRNT